MQRAKTHYAVPRLLADAPAGVWSGDITKLATWPRGVFLSLYVALDLYSRFVVAWMVAGRENSALAKHRCPPKRLGATPSNRDGCACARTAVLR